MEEKNYLIPGSIVLAGAIIAAAVFYVGRGGSGSRENVTAGKNPPLGTQQETRLNPGDLADDDPLLGNPDAPVTMVEFSDFECPFCGRFWRTTLPEIKERYIKTGKVKFIYRDFPITSIHSNAQKAAEAAECADEQGQFWAYHDLIFQHQDALGVANYKRWAAEIGLDTARFNSCLDAGKYTDEVAKDFRDGQAAGVTGTPTFFINGRSVVGALPFEQLASVIDAALAGK